MLSASAEHVKWLFGEVRRASCEFWGKWELKGTGVKALDRSYKKWDVAEAEQHLMEMAAIKGDLDLIKWLRSQDPPCEWSKRACTAAASGNHWDLLLLFVSMSCPIDKGGMFGAVACDPNSWYYTSLPDSWDGKFEMLKWLSREEQGCVFDGDAMISHYKEVVTDASECSISPFNALLSLLTWCFFCS